MARLLRPLTALPLVLSEFGSQHFVLPGLQLLVTGAKEDLMLSSGFCGHLHACNIPQRQTHTHTHEYVRVHTHIKRTSHTLNK